MFLISGFKRYFLVLLFIFLFSGVVSATNENTVQGGAFTNGLTFEYPKFFVLKSDVDHSFYFHVFNTSSGLLIGDGLSCYFQLYNDEGKHLVADEVSVFDLHNGVKEVKFFVKGENFSVGSYSYVAQCNNSDAGGFISSPLEVSFTGEGNIGIRYNYWLELFLFVFCWVGFVIGINYKNYPIAMIFSFLMIILGVYGLSQGLLSIDNWVTQSFSIIQVCVGALVLLVYSYEEYKDW